MSEVLEASNSVRSLPTDSYNAAAKRFVTKDFAGSLELVQPLVERSEQLVKAGQLSETTLGKVWVLYATLCDVAFNEDDGWPRKARRALTVKITEGTFWDELRAAHGGSLANVAPSVVLAVANVAVKHEGALASSTTAVEEHLSHLDSAAVAELPAPSRKAYQVLLRIFVEELLVGVGDFDYAREFVSGSSSLDDNQKTEMLHRLDQRQQAFDKLREERAQKEEDRVNKAIAEPAPASTPAAGESAGSNAIRPSQSNQSTTPPSSQPSSYARDVSKSPRGSPGPRDLARQRTPTNVRARNLREVWRMWINKIRDQSFMNFILVVLLLVAAVSNRPLRARVAQAGAWIFAAAKRAATMGLTVTYL